MRCGLRDCRRSCNSKNTSTAAAPRFCRSDGSREADDLTETVLIAIPRRCGACLCPDCGEAVDHVLRASRLPSLLQQQQQHQQQQRSAFVGATEVAKPVTSRQSYRPPSCDAAVPAFVLIAEDAVDHALQASRLASLLQQQQQHQQQRPAFVGATEVAKPVTSKQSYWWPSCGAAVPAFVLIAGNAADHALRASRLASLLQQQKNINSGSSPLL